MTHPVAASAASEYGSVVYGVVYVYSNHEIEFLRQVRAGKPVLNEQAVVRNAIKQIYLSDSLTELKQLAVVVLLSSLIMFARQCNVVYWG